jgi:pimeloyl-ACP methyl ester carboxylesterase
MRQDAPVSEPLTVRMTASDGPVQVWVWPASDRTLPGPVLLACHGWTDSGEVFGPLAEALGRRWTVVAPDAPAHGGTPMRRGAFRIAGHATSALSVLDALPRVAGRVSTVVLLGHSMGALTASRLAAARPELVSALVLEDPARTTPRRIPSAVLTRRSLRGLTSGDHTYRMDWARVNHPQWPDDELGPWARSKAAVDAAHLETEVDWGEPLFSLLADVPAPVLLIRGEPARGGIVSRTGAQRCAAACPGGSEILVLPAGHCPRREARPAFVQVLSTVLAAAAQ